MSASSAAGRRRWMDKVKVGKLNWIAMMVLLRTSKIYNT
jgi:hypothetical protein